MAMWEVVRHRVAIAGRITESQTGRSVNRARVEITAAPEAFSQWLANYAKQYGESWTSMAERPDRTLTAGDGHFHWVDLPDGQYTLVASLPEGGSRYGEIQTVVNVSRDAQGDLVMTTADMTLPPTTIEGRITRQGATPAVNVVMAEVRIKGSGERTFSDDQGHYRLTGVEPGERTVLVAASGYQPAAKNIQINQAGEAQTLDFALLPVSA